MVLTGEEIRRKVLHFFFGMIFPGVILYVPSIAGEKPWFGRAVAPWGYPAIILAAVLLFLYSLEQLRFRVPSVQRFFTACAGAMMRREESGKMTGATYMVMAALVCSIAFRRRPDISFIALSTFIWGDAAAALVGLSIGRIRIGGKSLEGSLACLSVCLLMFFVLFPRMPLVLDAWNGSAPVALAVGTSLCITILELIPFRLTRRLVVNDNLAVPVIAAIAMLCIERFVAGPR